MNSLTKKILGGTAATAIGLGVLVGGAGPATAVPAMAADSAGHHHADGHDHGDDVGILANHNPNANPGRLCNYTTFEALGADGAYHRYVYMRSHAVPGGGREAQWRAYHPSSTGWTAVGYAGRIC